MSDNYKPNNDRYKNMKFNRCGKSGLKLPPIALGLWQNFGTNADIDKIKNIILTAFDKGVTYFDLANNYGPLPGAAELNFGKILKSDLMPYRDEMVIATKAGYTMWQGPYGDFGSRKYLLSSLDQSLKRLGLDYVDIFYHHRMDKETPLEETMLALAQAVNSGKALYVGLSNYDGETMLKASAILKDLKCPFIVNQNRYTIFDRTIENNGLKKASSSDGKGIAVFSPLEQGILAGRYKDGVPADSRFNSRSLSEGQINMVKTAAMLDYIAAERGQTLAQMALSWVLKDSDVTSAIIGASSVEQLLENLGAVDFKPFTSEELRLIDKYVFED